MQKKTNTIRDIIVVGFALFSMFFGAGNVIFPPYLGMEAGPQWLAGFSAYFIADIGLALLGVFALLRVGSSEAVTRRVGKVPSEILMCAIILCIGPMVAIPRTSATTFEMAIAPHLSGVSPVLFSVLFFAVILALCIKESAVVDIVGKILTPLLLLGLFAIIVKGIITPLGDIAALPQIANVAVTGIKAGYQTMDALAALPFGIIVLQSVASKGYDSGRKQFRAVSGAAVLAGILLLAVYMGLAYLGATVSAQYTGAIGRAQLIMAIVEALMGKVGMILFGVVVSGLRHHRHRPDQLRRRLLRRAVPRQGVLQGVRHRHLRVQRRGVQSGPRPHRGRGRPRAGCDLSPHAGADLYLPADAPGAGSHQPRRRHRRAADQCAVHPHGPRCPHPLRGQPAPVRSGSELAAPRRCLRSGSLPSARPFPHS